MKLKQVVVYKLKLTASCCKAISTNMVLKSALITFLVLAASAKAEEEIEDEVRHANFF